ncbi:MAG: hypothetical protein GY733_09710, partial [bacterium]|nr:hypothetical protein [bacterium]
MPRSSRLAFGTLLLIVALPLLFAATSGATDREEPLDLVLRDEPLGDVVKAIAARTGNRYVFEPPLPGRVTVAVPARVSAAEAAEILNATLLIKGFAALPMAPGHFKIVRWDKLKSESPYTEQALHADREGGVTTRISLRYAKPEDVARALRPLVQGSGQVIAYPPSSSLILAGTENRVRRLIEIAQNLDAAEHIELMVRRVRYRTADEVHKQLEALTSRSKKTNERSPEVVLHVDQRTNALLVTAPPTELVRIREWIDLIDIPAVGEGDVQVIRLFHQDPQELASLLSAQAGGGRLPTSGPTAVSQAGTLIGRDFSVVAHNATHSLVIRADLGTFQILRQLIAELDREPRMVKIDVGFYELTTDGNLALGAGGVIPAIEPKDQDDTALVFLPNAYLSPTTIPGLIEPNPEISALGTPVFQISGESVIIPVLDRNGNPVSDASGQPQVILIPGLGISLLAQQTYAQIEVTNRPSLTVAVGEESQIFIGDDIPIPVGSTNIADLVSLGPSLRVDIQRESVGTELKLKPVYNEGGDLRVELSLELSLVGPGGSIETGPILSHRKLEASLRAGFDQRMIIAGLNSETKGVMRTSVPFLSAIPLLGRLFTAEIETLRRTYSLISLTATLLPTQEEKQQRKEALARAIAQ